MCPHNFPGVLFSTSQVCENRSKRHLFSFSQRYRNVRVLSQCEDVNTHLLLNMGPRVYALSLAVSLSSLHGIMRPSLLNPSLSNKSNVLNWVKKSKEFKSLNITFLRIRCDRTCLLRHHSKGALVVVSTLQTLCR